MAPISLSTTSQDTSSLTAAEFEMPAAGAAGGRAMVSGTIRIGKLQWGGKGPTAVQLVSDVDFRDVRVDRHGSHVGNPFVGAATYRLCKAFDELLQAVLTTQLSIETGLHDYEVQRRRDVADAVELTDHEEQLLRTIADRHQVRVHSQTIRPLDLRAWLIYHASLVASGHSLRLLCWCICEDHPSSQWRCHSQSLRGAILWLASTHLDEFICSVCAAPESASDAQVPAWTLPSCAQPILLGCAFHECLAFYLPLSQIRPELDGTRFFPHLVPSRARDSSRFLPNLTAPSGVVRALPPRFLAMYSLWHHWHTLARRLYWAVRSRADCDAAHVCARAGGEARLTSFPLLRFLARLRVFSFLWRRLTFACL